MSRIFLSIFVFLVLLGCNSNKSTVDNKESNVLEVDSIEGVYIPKDLDDCFLQLDSFWDDDVKDSIKTNSERSFLAESDFGIGQWIRNNWIRVDNSRLSEYFNEKGVHHPDDISSIILTSYYRRLQNKPIELEKQISYYDLYWKVNSSPDKKLYPKGVKNLNVKVRYDYNSDELPRCLHVFIEENTNKIWLYDYHYGWKKVDENKLREIKSNAPLKQSFVEGLFDK